MSRLFIFKKYRDARWAINIREPNTAEHQPWNDQRRILLYIGRAASNCIILIKSNDKHLFNAYWALNGARRAVSTLTWQTEAPKHCDFQPWNLFILPLVFAHAAYGTVKVHVWYGNIVSASESAFSLSLLLSRSVDFCILSVLSIQSYENLLNEKE